MRRSLAVAVAIVVSAFLLVNCQTPEQSAARRDDSIDSSGSPLLTYMSCLGFSEETASKTFKVANGDREKILAMTHAAISGELSGDTPLSVREKNCLKSSGL